jgi:hypothetical protein
MLKVLGSTTAASQQPSEANPVSRSSTPLLLLSALVMESGFEIFQDVV